MNVQLYQGDCLEILPTLTGVDAVVTDPPYGIALDTDYSRYPNGKTYKRIVGDSKPFDFTPWQKFPAREQFWFGAENYINLATAGSWLCWDKYPTDKSDGRLSGQFELIWSKQRHKRVLLRIKAINTSWVTVKDAVGHPTQKPVELMRLLIEKFTKPGDTVFDPYMGSGSTGVAAVQTGRNFIGVELDSGYFAIAQRRIAEAQMQVPLLEVTA